MLGHLICKYEMQKQKLKVPENYVLRPKREKQKSLYKKINDQREDKRADELQTN